MNMLYRSQSAQRYRAVTNAKAAGATYTPKILSDYVARQLFEISERLPSNRPLRVLDPAIGHGELLVSLLEQFTHRAGLPIEVYGFETNPDALGTAKERLEVDFPDIPVHFEFGNFLEFVLAHFGSCKQENLFCQAVPGTYDVIIANPPYVRTQIMGAEQAQLLAEQFGLSGRLDLYYAFILAISQVLAPQGIAGIIVSNRFMTTKSGAVVRDALFDRFKIRHAWDLGDTKLFGAAVLPAVLLVENRNGQSADTPAFTSIYQTDGSATKTATDVISALGEEGVVRIPDGRHFQVQHGQLNTGGHSEGVWRIGTDSVNTWLDVVNKNAWGTFRDIGKIRVGVKTCADKVFIRNDWQDMPDSARPELLRPLTTHHIARRFKSLALDQSSQILYPHEVLDGCRRAIDLECYPKSRIYLESHRSTLENRRYVIEAGREWYEIWVPQNPDVWSQPKLVFRDIAEEPTFWLDFSGSIVNGDCYWLTCQESNQSDLLWLAAGVGNSTFIERFYDLLFNNKLYAGRRRFITQYVEQFPLPDPHSSLGKMIIKTTKQMYNTVQTVRLKRLQKELDAMIWEAFTGNETV